jgi:carbonic anhydrase
MERGRNRMKLLEEILTYNEQFVAEKKYEAYLTTKIPNKHMVIVTCMDTRLLELLPKALNLGNGDVKIVKDAGALITHPFGSVMRSILVAIYELQAEEVFIIGHHDCGMAGLKADPIIEKMKERGVKEETINTLSYSGIDVSAWLKGFDNVIDSVSHSVNIVRNHPLLPENVAVHGLVIDPATGKLDLIESGYELKE